MAAPHFDAFCVQHGPLYSGDDEAAARAAAGAHGRENPRCEAFDNLGMRIHVEGEPAVLRRLPDEAGSTDYTGAGA